MIETLDQGLRAELTYTETPKDKLTVIYVPGLGTMGLSTKKALRARNRLKEKGYDMNLVTFTYSSHNGNTLSGFENDSKDLGAVVEKLEQRDIPREKIGFFGVCYGAYVSLQYLAENDDVGFAVMLEPYLGFDSLRAPLQWSAKAAKQASRLWIPKLPIGRRYGKKWGCIDLRSFLASQEQIPPNRTNTPVIALSTKFHKFFDLNNIAKFMQDSGHEYFILKNGRISSEMTHIVYNRISDFLREHFPQ
ncbi:hypothetical protein KY331_03710 [Candidatus Woesearchaeota archaeon]|nr:hypothetical protein [Candidatus Woesearchaeota archaeon]